MSRFESTAAWSLVSALLAEHGEPVTYRGRNAADATVTAIVERDPLDAVTGGRLEYQLVILVAKADIPAPVVNADQVQLPRRSGDSATSWYTVTALLDQYGALWRLGLT
jgi:hypothetical protein